MGNRNQRTSLILGIALVWLGAHGAGAAPCDPDLAQLRWPGGHTDFQVEIADDPAERAKGLMFRRDMPADSGMLFVFERPQSVSFWMKNTLIPLDMLFIAADGTVEQISEMAIPQDETPIPGGADIKFVLEVNGGTARRLGLPKGAVLRHPMIEQPIARWPCGAP